MKYSLLGTPPFSFKGQRIKDKGKSIMNGGNPSQVDSIFEVLNLKKP
jgi:hypothetical protein